MLLPLPPAMAYDKDDDLMDSRRMNGRRDDVVVGKSWMKVMRMNKYQRVG